MVQLDLLKAVNDSVDSGLLKAALPNTPQHRLDVLIGMHIQMTAEKSYDASVVKVIEDEIVRLQDELL